MASDQKRIVLIDLSSLWWTNFHATAAEGVSQAAKLTENAVRRCFKQGEDLVAICCDAGTSFRKKLFEGYKAGRPERDATAYDQLRRLKEVLRAQGFLLWEAETFEADDVIATATHAARTFGHEVLVCSADKDLLQLVTDEAPQVRVLRTHKWVEGGTKDVVESFGVEPGQLGDWLALVGDKSDNIAGAAGVGPKTATILLSRYPTLKLLYGALLGTEDAPATAESAALVATPAVVKSLIANMEQVGLARKLVTLRTDAPFDFREVYAERAAKVAAPEVEAFMDDPTVDFEDDRISGPKPGSTAGLTEKEQASVRKAEERLKAAGTFANKPVPSPSSEGLEKAAAELAAKLKEGDRAEAKRREGKLMGDPGREAPGQAKAEVPKAPASGAATPSPARTSPAPATVEVATVPPATAPVTSPGSSLARISGEAQQLAPVEYERGLEPRSLKSAAELSTYLAASRLYTKFPNEHAILAVIIRGRELGIGVGAALDSFHVIEGKPSATAMFIMALAEAHPDCEYFRLVSDDATHATYETKHRKHPVPKSHTFTIQDAVDRGLCGLELIPRTAPPGEKDRRGQWDKNRKAMIRKTAGVELARIVYPSIGLYSIEELGGEA